MNNIYKKAAKGISILVLMKIFSRIIDFVLNILIVREVDPDEFGLTMHLGLLTNLILFYSRISLKNSYQKRSIKNKLDSITVQSAENMMFFGSLVSLILSIILCFIWIYLYNDLNSGFSYASVLYSIGAFIESYGEMFLVQSILNFEYSISAKTETISIFFKTVCLYFLQTFQIFSNQTLVNFGFAQLFYSILHTICAYQFTKLHYKQNLQLFPKKIKNKYYVHQDMKKVTQDFTFLSILKMFLSEIEKIVLINFTKNSSTNAEFSLISNLGSMVPRFIYQPIEEICYNLFSKIYSSKDTQQNKQQKLKSLLQTVFELINMVGIFAITFGIPLSHDVLLFLYGEKWSSPNATVTLQLFCIYELAMGLNGISEAFVLGNIQVGKQSQFYRYGQAILSIFYVALCISFSQFGAAGLIFANILSMTFRILLCFYFIQIQLFNSKITETLKFFTESFQSVKFNLLLIIQMLVVYFIVPQFVQKPIFKIIISAGIASFFLLVFLKNYKPKFQQLMQQKNNTENNIQMEQTIEKEEDEQILLNQDKQ